MHKCWTHIRINHKVHFINYLKKAMYRLNSLKCKTTEHVCNVQIAQISTKGEIQYVVNTINLHNYMKMTFWLAIKTDCPLFKCCMKGKVTIQKYLKIQFLISWNDLSHVKFYPVTEGNWYSPKLGNLWKLICTLRVADGMLFQRKN